MKHNCDFSGWATRNDLVCSDGRTIKKDAFKHNDGCKVPLVWNHQHNEPDNVLGHAILENRDEGVYAYCSFNSNKSGQEAKEIVAHGDVSSLSIYANRLRQVGDDVIHGIIREVSLVLAGANPGAYIDTVMAHGDGSEEGIIANYDERIIIHADYKTDDKSDKKDEGDSSKDKTDDKTEKTVRDVYEAMSEEQKKAVQIMVGEALASKNNKDDSEGGQKEMKHNVFSNDGVENSNYLSHADQAEILGIAKSSNVGSLQAALQIYADDNNLEHADIAGASGFGQPPTEGNISLLFPDYKDVRPGAPELITNDQGWIGVVMSKVHKSPISRIRTGQVDIRKAEQLRAKGYKKGSKKKLTGNIALVRRTTDPQTVYVKNALHRDDVVDITDFDYVNYLYNIDRMMLDEELATAIMLGDGRDVGDEDKISEDHIRPIWTDDELYTLHVDLDVNKAKQELQGTGTGTSFGENYILAEALINAVLYAREDYKGSGRPDFYCTPHMLNVMLLARDMNGRRIYSTVSELAAALNVGSIYTAEQFEGKTRKTSDNKTKKLLGMIVNLADYSLGATKGGEVTHFTDFDIDFNQLKSLLETRCSGALTKIQSAICIEEDVTSPSVEAEG